MTPSSTAMQPQKTVIVDLDSESLRLLALTGPWCLCCPLCESRHRQAAGPTDPAELEPLVRDDRSGVKIALTAERVTGYAVFGQPVLFPGLERLGLVVDEKSLFIGALYATPPAREQNVHADLLIAVINFARGHGYQTVAAAFRPNGVESPEPTAELLLTGGFTLETADSEIGLATITLDDWDKIPE